MKETMVQFGMLIVAAAACSWLAEIWRLEGRKHVNDKETDGSIAKQALVSEGEKVFKELIAHYESMAGIKAGKVEGWSKEQIDKIRATAEFERDTLTNQDVVVNAHLADAMQGPRIAIGNLQSRMSSVGGPDQKAIGIVMAYLVRAENLMQEERSWGHLNCLPASPKSREHWTRSFSGAPIDFAGAAERVRNPFAEEKPRPTVIDLDKPPKGTVIDLDKPQKGEVIDLDTPTGERRIKNPFEEQRPKNPFEEPRPKNPFAPNASPSKAKK